MQNFILYSPFNGRTQNGSILNFYCCALANFPCILLLCAASKMIIWRPIFTKWFFLLFKFTTGASRGSNRNFLFIAIFRFKLNFCLQVSSENVLKLPESGKPTGRKFIRLLSHNGRVAAKEVELEKQLDSYQRKARTIRRSCRALALVRLIYLNFKIFEIFFEWF